jgi:hypothetical protein
VFDLEIYFWCVVGCYSSTSCKSDPRNVPVTLPHEPSSSELVRFNVDVIM